jgi:auxin-responsive protein IAA
MHFSICYSEEFTCFLCGAIPGKCDSNGSAHLGPTDLLNGSEFVLTYEDKDGDWMLVGDVPWEYVQ